MDELGRPAPPAATVEARLDAAGARVVHLGGEIDISNVALVESELAALLPTLSRPVTVDVSQLSFMDSSGVAMLLRAAERLGPISLRAPTRVVEHLIQATGLDEVLRVEPGA